MKISAHLGSVASVGTVFSAVAVAVPCCLPPLASAGAALGLGLFAPYQASLAWLLQSFIVLALASHIQSFRRHRNAYLLALAFASAAALLYAYNVRLAAPLVYGGLAGLAVSAAWGYVENRRRGACQPVIQTQSRLTCPQCGFRATETMPTDACLYFYECPACKGLLKPKTGDCCVFCSYGDVRCPPKQTGSPCCA
jgi:hypothetical protein